LKKAILSSDNSGIRDARNAIDELETFFNTGSVPVEEKPGEYPVLYYKVLRALKKLARENQEQKESIFKALSTEMDVMKLGVLAISKRSKKSAASLIGGLVKFIFPDNYGPDKKRSLINTLRTECDMAERAINEVEKDFEI